MQGIISSKIITLYAFENNSHTAEFTFLVRDFGRNKNSMERRRTGAIFRPAFKVSRLPPVSIRSFLRALQNTSLLLADQLKLIILALLYFYRNNLKNRKPLFLLRILNMTLKKWKIKTFRERYMFIKEVFDLNLILILYWNIK